MKAARLISRLLMLACLIFGLTGCKGTSTGSSSSESSSPDASVPESDASQNSNPSAGSGVLVAYFSATGSTRAVAEQIAALTNGDLCQLPIP